ncbi:MAG: hypothetical protein A2X94_07795 [Bdellovibrionales bacterium GWB1_55_8]|nr:MAG: hypothetical protein A2X94_07795 [Bdellovibrionales bacterium GWB1_55_8]
MRKHLTFLSVLLVFTSSVLAAPPQQSAPTPDIEGRVEETMNSGGYTYLRLKTASGDVWAAVSQTTVKVGSTATVVSPMLMQDFESKTLKKKFSRIFFGSLGGSGGAAKPSMPPQMGFMKQGAQQPHGTATPALKLSEIKVEKAKGTSSKTVAEVYAQKASLKGKEITIRGKVTKASFAIMGKNWLHLSDGSGKLEDKNYDLTISTAARAQVGEVILVKGILSTDKDIGAGYFYPVLLEDAKIEK